MMLEKPRMMAVAAVVADWKVKLSLETAKETD